MDYPVYIDGKRAGTLTVTWQEGAVTLSASLKNPGRVVRLTVFGEREAYIGVPQPENGLLRLEKRLTGEAARSFPQKPAYAAEHKTELPAVKKLHVLWHGGKPHYF